VLVFVQTKERAESLYHQLLYEKIPVDFLNSDRSSKQRVIAVKNFRRGKTWFLIATDILARGMDFKGVNCVINYDFPPSIKNYIHRIGRTGRMGRQGVAITFYTKADIPLLKLIANVMSSSGCKNVPEWMLNLAKLSKKKSEILLLNNMKKRSKKF